MNDALIRELLDEYLETPLEGTSFTPRSFEIETPHGNGITRVRIRGAPGWTYFDMLHDERISANANLYTQASLRRKGIGSGFVALREELCRTVGIERIIIGHNNNDSFWRNRGYEDATQPRYYRALAAIGRIKYDEVHFKRPLEKTITADPINPEPNRRV